MPDGPNEKLLSSGQVAAKLGISPRTLAKYVREGRMRPTLTLPSGHYRWAWRDVEDQLKQWQQED